MPPMLSVIAHSRSSLWSSLSCPAVSHAAIQFSRPLTAHFPPLAAYLPVVPRRTIPSHYEFGADVGISTLVVDCRALVWHGPVRRQPEGFRDARGRHGSHLATAL